MGTRPSGEVLTRKATSADLGPVMGALIAMLDYSPAPQMKFAHIPTAEAAVLQAIREGRGWFVGGYYIMVDVGSDWYSNVPYLIEQIILKVYPDDRSAKVSDAIAFLPTIASLFGAKLIAAGDTQVNYMTPRYIAEGFKIAGTQLVKEVP